jgi:hypothetical protein
MQNDYQLNRRKLLKSLGAVGTLGYSDFALSDEYRYSREKYGYPNYRDWGGQSRPWEWRDSLYEVSEHV